MAGGPLLELSPAAPENISFPSSFSARDYKYQPARVNDGRRIYFPR